MSISNSEQNVVSEMATAIAKMLDSDKKNLVSTNEELSDNEGFFMWVKDGAPGLHVQLNGAGKVPHITGKDASASQEEMWAAYRRWQERKIIAHAEARPARRWPLLEFAAQVLTLQTLLIVIGCAAVVAAAGSITSCSIEAYKTEKSRDDEVNKYGFKRGNIASRYVYPDGCKSATYVQSGTSYPMSSVYECKRIWEQWERDGEVWVDWKEPT